MIQIYDKLIGRDDLKNLNRDITFKMPWYFSMDGQFDSTRPQVREGKYVSY